LRSWQNLDELEAEIKELVSDGKTIVAIKRYREASRLGLAEAMLVVERFVETGILEASNTTQVRTSSNGPPEIEPSSGLQNDVISLPSSGKKIDAIKLCRREMGAGLKEANEAVGKLGEQHGVPASNGGCLEVVLFLIWMVLQFL
jgi:ribosomal protein L7/L12